MSRLSSFNELVKGCNALLITYVHMYDFHLYFSAPLKNLVHSFTFIPVKICSYRMHNNIHLSHCIQLFYSPQYNRSAKGNMLFLLSSFTFAGIIVVKDMKTHYLIVLRVYSFSFPIWHRLSENCTVQGQYLSNI